MEKQMQVTRDKEVEAQIEVLGSYRSLLGLLVNRPNLSVMHTCVKSNPVGNTIWNTTSYLSLEPCGVFFGCFGFGCVHSPRLCAAIPSRLKKY